jgi:effector-binding domain-containing protein
MRILKIIVIIILALIAALLIVAAILPKDFHIDSNATIDKNADMVFKEVNNFKNWSAWSPWEAEDPEMTSRYEGPPLGVGAKHIWESETMGDGSQTILESVPYERIVTELDFYERGKSTSYFTFEEIDGKTRVEWGLDTETSYPFERLMFAAFKGSMEGMFQKGLNSLKEVVERKADYPDVEVTTLPEMTVVATLDSCYWEEGPEKMGEMFGKLTNTIERKNLAITGLPYTQYLIWDEDRQFMVFEAGIPVNKTIMSRGDILSKTMPETRAIKATHIGAYDKSGIVYTALDEYVLEHGMEMTAGPIEMYVTDPMNEPDTAQWRTDIYFPIK